MLVVALGLGGYWLASRKHDRHYSADIRGNFLRTCAATGGNSDGCLCALNELEKHYTSDQFAAIEGDYLRTGVLPPEMLTAASSCAQLQPLGQAAAPTTPLTTTPPAPTIDQRAATVSSLLGLADDIYGHFLPVPGQAITKDSIFGEVLCISISVTNVGRSDAFFLTSYLSVVRPSGQTTGGTGDPDVLTPVLGGLVPGGSGSITQCFQTNGERGVFTLRYAPPNESPRAWTFTV